MPSFSDSFWGEKNNGFDILSQNLKNGQTSSKEFAEFLRESCSVEETYAKLLSKLAKLASNCCTQGSYGPLWQLMKAMTEKLSNLHLQLVHSWQDLIKDVHRYCDEQHKKHKSIKDQEASTLESVRTIQQTTIAVQKSKENYHARCLDFERVKRDNGTTKEIEKAETKCKKAKDDYENLIDKYCNARNDFEKKMRDACQKFQEAEEYHLRQMKDFIETYSTAWEHQHVLQGRCHEEFKVNSKEYTVDKLITLFITNKTTGSQIPGAIEFEEADLSSLGAEGANGTDEIPRLEKPSKTPGFLMKSRREKKKEKKKKKKEKSQVRDQNDDQNQPQVDEEGFSIRPDNPFENHEDRNSWYSSSDSDSDGEERKDKKIKVEIKPLAAFSPNGANGSIPSDNVDVIKQSIQGLRLSPTSNRRPMMGESHMKKSTSLTDSMKGMEFSSPAGGGNASDDLLGLDLFGVHTSSASTPTSSFAFNSNFTTPNTSGQDEGGNMPLKQRSQTPTSGIPLLTGPPPPRSSPRTTLPAKATVRPAGRMSPAFGGSSNQSTGNLNSRADSIGNLNSGATFSTTSMSIGSSRGPSPLTIGMSDNIPLAIAFSETVNVYFKGADESNTKVKLTGDMKVSFPAGIVKVLMDNPSPQPLSFRVKNTSTFEHILVNKQLIQQDASESSSDTAVYQFDMTSLTDHLRRQVEQNRVASYFNIDILKYQVKSGLCMHSIPLHLLCYWKCEQAQTDFRLDYKFNRSQRGALGNVNVLVPVDGEVTHMQSKPTATWSSDNKRAVWKLGDLSEHSEGGGHGTLRAKFDLSDGPSNPRAVAVQFVSEGMTMSGVDFELAGPGYRVSLVKKRLVTGKYIAEPESDVKYVLRKQLHYWWIQKTQKFSVQLPECDIYD